MMDICGVDNFEGIFEKLKVVEEHQIIFLKKKYTIYCIIYIK